MNGPNTPGFFGYVVAVLVSFVAFGFLVGFFAMLSAADPLAGLAILLLYAPMAAAVAGTYGLPVALAGAALVALGLRRVAPQPVHVLGAGLVGLVLTPVYLSLVGLADDDSILMLSVAVGLAAALGRLAVVPLVRSRRRLDAEGRLT